MKLKISIDPVKPFEICSPKYENLPTPSVLPRSPPLKIRPSLASHRY